MAWVAQYTVRKAQGCRGWYVTAGPNDCYPVVAGPFETKDAAEVWRMVKEAAQ